MVFGLVSSVQEKLGDMLDSEMTAAAAAELTEEETKKKEEEVSDYVIDVDTVMILVMAC